MAKRKFISLFLVAALVMGTMAAGVFYKHYFVVCMFAVWLSVEFFLWQFPNSWRSSRASLGRVTFPAAPLVALFVNGDVESQSTLEERISQIMIEGGQSPYEQRWMERLKALIELRGLAFSEPGKGRKRLRQAFTFSCQDIPQAKATENLGLNVSSQDITESATVVADLYWKLYDTGLGKYPELTKAARHLFGQIFGENFDNENSRKTIEKLTDSIQRDRGLPFVILNLIRQGNWQWGRQIAQILLREAEEIEMDEEIRSSLYWVSEIHWFTKERKSVLIDYESTIRYLYHLCFTNPDRAGFLEIDSHFYSQFENVSELAREGFLFKESLIEKILILWKEHEGYFDDVFQGVLESMTQQKSKIYDERENWERFWKRERENFCREYLYLVEGNLSYASQHYDDAHTYYEKALRLSPRLRPALLNLVFCYAKLGALERHQLMVEKVMGDKNLLPASLYVVGDSYLLLGDEARAEAFYEELRKCEGWEHKIDYYKSTFCYENKIFEKALGYAKKAHERNPNDSSIRFHLSLCYNSVGQKDQALDMVRHMGDTPQWLNYYKFTLERDVGRLAEASETLLRIPTDYFQDPDELEAAMDFAKGRQDLVLLRHLIKKD